MEYKKIVFKITHTETKVEEVVDLLTIPTIEKATILNTVALGLATITPIKVEVE